MLRVCKDWYLAAVGPLWVHGTLRDLMKHVPFPERQAHYAAWLQSRGTEFNFMAPCPLNLKFIRLRACAFNYWTLAGTDRERFETLKPLLQPALNSLVLEGPAVVQGMGGLTTEKDHDITWLGELPKRCPYLTVIELQAINVDSIHLVHLVTNCHSLTKLTLGASISHLLDKAVLHALAFSESLRVLVLEGHSLIPAHTSALTLAAHGRQPFQRLQELTVECDDGAGRVAASILQKAESLEALTLRLNDTHLDWDDDLDSCLFQKIGNLSNLQYLTISMPHHVELNADSLLCLSGLQHLEHFRTWGFDWPETEPAAIEFASHEIISWFNSLPKLKEMCIHSAIIIHNEQVSEKQRLDEIYKIPDHGGWTFGVFRVSSHSNEGSLSDWEPPVADPGLMLGINLNFVPGGNPVVLEDL